MKDAEYYGYVYLTMDMLNDKVYIGQKKGKVEDSTDYFGSGTIIRRIIKKRGTSDLKKLILEVCYSKEELTERETFYKFKYNAFDRLFGYNIAIVDMGGDNWTYHPNKKEWGLKISIANTGKTRTISKETRELISKSKKGCKGLAGDKNGMFNTCCYEIWEKKYGKEIAETKRKNLSEKKSIASKKVVHTEEWNKKVSNSRKGAIVSDETKRKISIASSKRIKSPETCKKISKSKLGKKRKAFSEEWKSNISKSVHETKHTLKNLSVDIKNLIKKDLQTLEIKEISIKYNLSINVIKSIKKSLTKEGVS